MAARNSLGPQFRYDERQDDDTEDGAHSITSDFGYISYSAHDGSNGVWGAQSYKKGHGSVLFDEMMKRHPAKKVYYGEVTPSGDAFARKQVHRYPEVQHFRASDDGGRDVRYRRRPQ